ncbi:MAG: hypothetical protein SH857_07250 [Chitinophagales bacterium]|nr:hypothetical protein [Chitinophagales bacterium]
MPLQKIPYDSLEPLIKKHLETKERPDGTEQLIKELKVVKKRGNLKKSELEIICHWKSARAIRLIKSNSEGIINKLSKEALNTRSEKRKMEFFTKLNGVSVPMASSILMFIDPKRYGVIDIRVWELLHSIGTMKTNPKGVNFKFNEWYRFLVIIRYYAKKFGVTSKDIERTLFYVHKDYQKGNLYDTLKK